MSAAMVFDEESGLAYEGYNAEMIRAFLILIHYTDLELSEWDNPQGRYIVYDAVTSHGLWEEIMDIVEADMASVDRIVMRLESSAGKRFEREYSLEYKLVLTLGSLLGSEDLAATVAKAEGLNSKLIDMLGAVQREKQQREIGGVRLAKRTEA